MQQDYKKHNGNWGMSLSIGISLGTGIGALMGNIGVGMTFGVALGTTLSLFSYERRGKK
jgi:galactitol-specific phosphotransferase system IIC component